MGYLSRGVIVVGTAAIAALVAMAIPFFIIVLSGHVFTILSRACEISPSGRQVCSPLSPWVWTIPCAGIGGAAAGAIGAMFYVQDRIRSPRRPTIYH